MRLLALLLLCLPALAMERAQSWCERGAAVTVSPASVGGSPAARNFQQSYPRCTVAVYATGSGGMYATIYSDNGVTPMANPFTADQYGRWAFYATNGKYDVQISGGSPPPALSVPYTFGAVELNDFSDGYGIVTGSFNGTTYVDQVIVGPMGRTFVQAPISVGPLPIYCFPPTVPTPQPCPNQPPSSLDQQGSAFSVLAYDPAYPMGCTGTGVNQCPFLIGKNGAVAFYSHIYNTPNFPSVWGQNTVLDKVYLNDPAEGSYLSAVEFTVRNYTNEVGYPIDPGALVGVRSNVAAGIASAAYFSQSACTRLQPDCGFAYGFWIDGLVGRNSTGNWAGGGTYFEMRDDVTAGGGASTGIDCSQVHGGFNLGCLVLPSVDHISGVASTALMMLTPTAIPYPALSMNANSDWLWGGSSGQYGLSNYLGAEGGIQLGFGGYPGVGSWKGSYTAISGTTAGNPTILTITGHGKVTGQSIVIAGYIGVWATGLGTTLNPQGVNGQFQVTVIDANTLSVPVNSAGFGAVTGTPKYLTGGTAYIATGVSQNTDLAGQLTLSAGTASYSFATAAEIAPICTAADTSASPVTPRVQATTGTLTISASLNHTFNYVCVKRN